MNRKISLLTMIFIAQIMTVFSQEEAENRFRKHAVGFSVGSLTGWGNTYRYFSEKAGFQVNTFIYMNDNGNVNAHRILASLGGSVMYSLKRVENFNVYTHLSAGYNYSKKNSYYNYYGSRMTENRNFSIGPGLGLEVRSEWMGINVYYGIGFNRNLSTFSMLQAGCGLYFYF
jgi:hypothetical protein